MEVTCKELCCEQSLWVLLETDPGDSSRSCYRMLLLGLGEVKGLGQGCSWGDFGCISSVDLTGLAEGLDMKFEDLTFRYSA